MGKTLDGSKHTNRATRAFPQPTLFLCFDGGVAKYHVYEALHVTATQRRSFVRP